MSDVYFRLFPRCCQRANKKLLYGRSSNATATLLRNIIWYMYEHVVTEIDQFVSQFSNRILAGRKEDSQVKFRNIWDNLQVRSYESSSKRFQTTTCPNQIAPGQNVPMPKRHRDKTFQTKTPGSDVSQPALLNTENNRKLPKQQKTTENKIVEIRV